MNLVIGFQWTNVIFTPSPPFNRAAVDSVFQNEQRGWQVERNRKRTKPRSVFVGVCISDVSCVLFFSNNPWTTSLLSRLHRDARTRQATLARKGCDAIYVAWMHCLLLTNSSEVERRARYHLAQRLPTQTQLMYFFWKIIYQYNM